MHVESDTGLMTGEENIINWLSPVADTGLLAHSRPGVSGEAHSHLVKNAEACQPPTLIGTNDKTRPWLLNYLKCHVLIKCGFLC